jgi:hypothetical protein
MKPLKTIIALCIMVGFATNVAKAQAQRYVYSTSYHEEHAYYACVDEPLTGDIEYDLSIAWMEGRNWGKGQERWMGILIGDISGDIYTLSQVTNNHHVEAYNNNDGGTGNWYWLSSYTIEKDGQPVAVAHILSRGTCNSATWDKKDGNWATWIEKRWIECY